MTRYRISQAFLLRSSHSRAVAQYLVCFAAEAHQEVVRLNITVKEASSVHILDSVNLRPLKDDIKKMFFRLWTKEILRM